MNTPHPLSKLFQPEHLLLIGASERLHSLGERIFSALLQSGFTGRITPVNPRHKHIGGIKAYAAANRVPDAADAAWVVTRPDTYDAVFAACRKKNIPHILLMQDWHSFTEPQWQQAQQAVAQARQSGLQITALNPAGISHPAAKLHGSVYPDRFPHGNVALIGSHNEFPTLLAPMLQQAGLGLSQHIGLCPKLTPDSAAALIDYFAETQHSQPIIVEHHPEHHLPALFSALRHCARKKALILHCSHGADRHEQAVLQHLAERCGFLPTFTPSQLQAALHALAAAPNSAEQLHLLANQTCGWLSPHAAALNITLHSAPHLGSNPGIAEYRSAVQQQLEHKHTQALLAVVAPTPDQAETGITTALTTLQQQSAKPLLISSPHAQGLMQFTHPETAVEAFAQQRRHRHLKQQQLLTAKPLPAHVKTPDAEAVSHPAQSTEHRLNALLLPEAAADNDTVSDGLSLTLTDSRYGKVLYAEYQGRLKAWLPPFNTLHSEQLLQHFPIKPLHKPLPQWLHSFNSAVTQLPALHTLQVWSNGRQHHSSLKLDPAASAAENVMAAYPDTQSHRFTLKNGDDVFIRPLYPEDAEAEQQYVQNLSEQSRQTRFMAHIKALNPAMLAKFCNLDYHREAAFVAAADDGSLLGVARYSCTRFPDSCEFGISVAENMHGQGLAFHLMQQIIERAALQGYRSMDAEILKSNLPMLKLAEKLGFHVTPAPHDNSLCTATRPLLPP